MELNKCMSCMEEFRGYPCPNCGYEPGKQKGQEYALPMETILAGKYLVGRVLGQGGFGITYVGWDIALERKVAIKEYYPSGQVSRAPGGRKLTWYTSDSARSARQNGMQMFLKEARKMAKLEEIPNVVRVRDLFQENETAYIVMDFVEGVTLKETLRKNGPMSWEQAFPIFRTAVKAMEQVHKAGLVHRDLSPDNLMLTAGGGVMILDLGAAKDLSVNSGASSMQVAKGGFSPYEQYAQRGSSGPWTDVYAMAATIYYTLTGKLPPTAVDRIAEDTINWDLPGLQELPAPALKTLKKSMAVLAKDRTQTMAELEKGLFSAPPKPKPKPAPKPQPEAKPAVKPKKNQPKWLIPAVAAVVALACGVGYWALVVKPANDNEAAYMAAQKLMDDGRYAEAAEAFSELGNYQDSAEQVQKAKELYWHTQRVVTLSAGVSHTVGILKNGTVSAIGSNEYGQCYVNDWSDIVAVATGTAHTVGLRSDGTVVATGNNECGQCNVTNWKNITSISSGGAYTVGLRNDGAVVAAGDNEYGQCNVSSWSDIVLVSAGWAHTVGLRSDGTVVATGNNEYGQCNVSDWTDIVSVTAGVGHTIGLRSDGTVVATVFMGDTDYYGGQCAIDDWSDMIAVTAGAYHTVGLRCDGTTIATESFSDGRCDVGNWSDIVAVSAGGWHTVGLRSDGTVVATGDNGDGQCDVDDWTDIRIP